MPDITYVWANGILTLSLVTYLLISIHFHANQGTGSVKFSSFFSSYANISGTPSMYLTLTIGKG